MHPNSQMGERGLWLAQQPGIGLSCEASDSVLGELVMFLRPHSKQGIPVQDVRSGVPFPLDSIAGVTSWGALTKSSPIMVQVSIDAAGIRIEKNAKDGGGYGPVAGETVLLPVSSTPDEIGNALRRALAVDA